MYPHKRRSEYRKQFKKFVISCEGSATEREYFNRIQSLCWNSVVIDLLTNKNKTSPTQVLDRIRNYSKSLSSGDETWCVIDKDCWTTQQFNELVQWQSEGAVIKRGIALSNPKFELWLLAHFMELPSQCGSSECDRLLEQFHPGYKKHLDLDLYTIEAIKDAIRRSIESCRDVAIPFEHTATSVGFLVERILATLK